MKKVVHFSEVSIFTWPGTEDQHAIVRPLDHPDRFHVTNTKPATTSKIISIIRDENGEVTQFETLNTIYRLKEK